MKEYEIRVKHSNGKLTDAYDYSCGIEDATYADLEEAKTRIEEIYANREKYYPESEKPNLVIVSRTVTEWIEEQ